MTQIFRNFSGERNTGFLAITAPRLQTIKQTLTTLKLSIEFTYSADFPCHFKVISNKPTLTFRRWKSKTGKRLTITTNFQERNLGTALSRKKIRPVGRIVKSWTGYERVISQSDSILEAGREKALASAGHVFILHPEILGVIN